MNTSCNVAYFELRIDFFIYGIYHKLEDYLDIAVIVQERD